MDMRYNNRYFENEKDRFDFMIENLSGKLSYKQLVV